MIAGMAVHSSM